MATRRAAPDRIARRTGRAFVHSALVKAPRCPWPQPPALALGGAFGPALCLRVCRGCRGQPAVPRAAPPPPLSVSMLVAEAPPQGQGGGPRTVLQPRGPLIEWRGGSCDPE